MLEPVVNLSCPVGIWRQALSIYHACRFTLSCFFVLHCLTMETSEGEGGRIGEGGRNKGEEEVGIDLSDSNGNGTRGCVLRLHAGRQRSEAFWRAGGNCPFVAHFNRDLKAVVLDSTVSRWCLVPFWYVSGDMAVWSIRVSSLLPPCRYVPPPSCCFHIFRCGWVGQIF